MSQAEELSRKAGGKLKDPIPGTSGKSYASDVSGQIRANAEATITSLLDGSASYGTTTVLPVDRPICIAYALRNIGAHQSSAPPVVSKRVTELRFAMIAALASCVTSYY